MVNRFLVTIYDYDLMEKYGLAEEFVELIKNDQYIEYANIGGKKYVIRVDHEGASGGFTREQLAAFIEKNKDKCKEATLMDCEYKDSFGMS
jgi:hypothetical protein